MNQNRREFLGKVTRGFAGTVLAAPALLGSRAAGAAAAPAPFRVGIIADIHQDIMHDGTERLAKFIEEMRRREVDCIINMGDFCVPHPRNDPFMQVWEGFQRPRFHVIGNHDMDEGFTREQVVKRWGMPDRYYSRDVGGIHLVVLDANDPDGVTKKYPMFIAGDQLAWLRADLTGTRLPVVLCSHQPLDAFDHGVVNAAEVRRILAEAKNESGKPKVVCAFSGHSHLDYVKTTDGIPHIQVNSASYAWTGIEHENYPAEITQGRPRLKKACPYAEPLWMVSTLDFQRGEIRIEGRSTTWVGPWALGMAEDDYYRSRQLSRPEIRDTQAAFGSKG